MTGLRPLLPLYLLLLAMEGVMRCYFLGREWGELDVPLTTIVRSLFIGAVYDTALFVYFFSPYLVYRAAITKSWAGSKGDHRVTAAVVSLFVLLLASSVGFEYNFWEELGLRPNQIAWDYFAYPDEVIAFLTSYYPVGLIIGAAVLMLTALYYGVSRWLERWDLSKDADSRRSFVAVAMLPAVATFLFLDQHPSDHCGNRHCTEVAKNGLYSLFHGLYNVDRPFDQVYATLSTPSVEEKIQSSYRDEDESLNQGLDLSHRIIASGEERRYNIILVGMESMSADFMERFGNKENLTPNLDRLAKESLFFTRHYAAATRTVRGLEAITLSVPPGAGTSIVRLPDNENLWSLGFLFRDRGYDTRFFYSGHARFDSMEPFFSRNGFAINDRRDIGDEKVTQETCWGVCDEDFLSHVIDEASVAAEKDEPFFFFAMTTSNHQPYTYPEGKVDIPSGTGRKGGVQYADYAIGRFIERAKEQPWFGNTLFVFVADHSAWSAGNRAVTLKKHQVPFIVYAPELLEPREVDTPASQLDVAPTLAGLLNFSYTSRFYGKDVLKEKQGCVTVTNFENLGLLKDGVLTVLKPHKQVVAFDEEGNRLKAVPKSLEQETIALFQHATHWKETSKHPALMAGG